MLGLSKYAAQGKTIRTQPEAVDITMQRVDILQSNMHFYKEIELLVDVIHVNDIPFIMSILESIYYGIISALDNLKYISLEAELKSIVRLYTIRGFKIVIICVDIQFKALQD